MTPSEILKQAYQHGPLVLGHRGARAYAPMNTMPAFELAAEQGVHGFELDVHLSKDGIPIIVHDFSIDATTNGTGLAADYTLEQLKQLDAGAWFDAKFAGTRIPTLEEVFQQFGQEMFINVEIKALSMDNDAVVQAVHQLVESYQLHNRVLISSFNPYVLKTYRQQAPDIALGYLVATENIQLNVLSPDDYEAFHPDYKLILAGQVPLATTHVLNTWTVNDPQIARDLVAMGVQGVITDNPDIILAALQ